MGGRCLPGVATCPRARTRLRYPGSVTDEDNRSMTGVGEGGAAGDGELRGDLDESARFLHQMGMQTKLDLSDTTARLHGLIEELIANGLVSMRKLEERTERARGE